MDEIQTGFARSGKLFCHQHEGVVPDIMTMAKGIGGGVPIGAILTVEAVASLMKPGMHGTTFGGNPLASSAGLATISAIEEENLRENAEKMGNLIREKMLLALQSTQGVVVVRNAGLMIGIELDRPCSELVKMALETQLLISVELNFVQQDCSNKLLNSVIKIKKMIRSLIQTTQIKIDNATSTQS